MPNLMTENGGIKRDFVAGKDEVDLFKKGDFARLHASTISKASFFSEVIHLILDGKLRTKRSALLVKIERGTDHAYAKLIGLAAAIYVFVDLGMQILNHLGKQ